MSPEATALQAGSSPTSTSAYDAGRAADPFGHDMGCSGGGNRALVCRLCPPHGEIQ